MTNPVAPMANARRVSASRSMAMKRLRSRLLAGRRGARLMRKQPDQADGL